MKDISKYLAPQVIEKMREEIRDALDNEVFFIGYTDDDLIVQDVEAVARGHKTAVPAVLQRAEEADVVIHNHPSGDLTPSEADLAIAAHLDNFRVAFYIVDNAVENLYASVEPFEKHEVKPLKVEEIERLLRPGGPVSKHLKGYENRPQQIQMIDVICDAFNRDQVCTVEAGTGTGKTMAYLLPAIFWATQNKERVVISTNTINLQEQLIKKDIPFLKKVLDVEFEAVLVKGRSNYVCLRKVDEVEGDFASLTEPEEVDELKMLIAWARTSKDGSKADLSYIPKEEVWEKIASESDTCTRNKCPHFRTCFVNKARRGASRAHILVVNHHLLFADLAIRNQIGSLAVSAVLPPYHRIIFDEAQHLEDVATHYFGVRITGLGIIRTLHRLHRRKDAMPRGYLHRLFRQVVRKRRAISNELFDDVQRQKDELVIELEQLVEATRLVMEQLYNAAREKSQEPENSELKIRLLPHVVDQLFLATGLDKVFKEYIGMLGSFTAKLHELLRLVRRAEEQARADWESQLIDVTAQVQRLIAVAGALQEVIFSDDEKSIRWIEIRKGYRDTTIVRFQSSPLDVSEMMKQVVYDQFSTVVMTSATLTVDQKFDFLAERIGLDKLPASRRTELILPSPFDFEHQVLLAIPRDMPVPNHPNFAEELKKQIFKALTISEGRAFVLFTSYGLLQMIYNQLKDSLEMIGIRVLRQGTENRHELLRRFRRDKTSVLFATDSFWEGVDVVGEALENVIITKLPFKVPSEPIIEARYEAIERNGGNAFMDYAVPLAVLKFKQGFGRLIRSRADRGSVIIFDTRVVQKSYGKRFLRSLPKCRTIIGTRQEVMAELKKFF